MRFLSGKICHTNKNSPLRGIFSPFWVCFAIREHIFLMLKAMAKKAKSIVTLSSPTVLQVVPTVLPYQPVQFHGRGKQFEVGFRPMDGIRQFLCRVQYALQSTETTILPEYCPFFGCRRSLFPFKDECRPYRLDVVPQLLFAVKRHIPLYKGR